jgi:hypothetical protein
MLFSANETVNNQKLYDLLTAQVALYTGCMMKLYNPSIAPTPQVVAADLAAAECAFTGYAPVALTAGPVVAEAGGGFVCNFSNAVFYTTTAATPDSAAGCWVEDSTGKILGVFPFSTPVPFSTPLAQADILLQVREAGPDSVLVST